MLYLRLLTGLLIGSAGFGLWTVAVANDSAVQPGPQHRSIGQLLSPEEKGQLVEVEGTVTFVGTRGRTLILELSAGSRHMQVPAMDVPAALSQLLLRSRVRISGISVGVQSITGETILGALQPVPSSKIVLLAADEEAWQHYPFQSISNLDARVTAPNPGGPVHLRGRVSIAENSTFTLENESGKITVAAVSEVAASFADGGRELEMLGVIESGTPGAVFRCYVSRPVLSGSADAVLPTLTSADQVHWLKPEEAARHYPVKLHGIVTWIQPPMPNASAHNGSVQDATGGIFVRNLVPRGRTINPGILCEIEGFTIPARFAPGVECTQLTFLGTGEFPAPVRPTWEEINSGILDVQWVEIQGVVASITNHSMTIIMKGGRLLCSVPLINDAGRYLNAVVRVRGIVVYHADTSRNFHGEHLDVPSEQFISIETPAPDASTLPLVRSASDLLRYQPDDTPFQRVKVIGQIVHATDEALFLMDGTNGFRVMPGNKTPGLTPGMMVEAIGFPGINDPLRPAVTVREAIVSRVGQKPLPLPQNISGDTLFNVQDATLVRVQALLLNMARYKAEQVFELQSGPQVYRARLNVDEAHALRFPVGSRLEVSGVYAVDWSARLDRSPFELLLNSPADIRVLQRPSWWTGPHTAMVIGSMALLLLLGGFWVVVLHQQVAKRTVQLSGANQSLRREMVERQRAEDELVRARTERLVEQERNRIARDLHDDLGSRVTRVVLMLDEFSLEKEAPTRETGDSLRKISAAAHEIIHSLDENVWAVNAGNDSLPHLIDYIGHFASDFLAAAGVRCRMDFPNDPPALPLSAEVRHNLFLAVKEALTNAVRHAQASEVWVRAAVADGVLTLTVEDDGKGFESGPAHPSADGLRNIQQRMDTLGGRFDLQTSRNNGTKVTLVYLCSPGK